MELKEDLDAQTIINAKNGAFRYDKCPIPELTQASRATVALYSEDKTFYGSGFIMREDNKLYLTTALHVLLHKSGNLIIIQNGESIRVKNPFIGLNKEAHTKLYGYLHNSNSSIHDIFYLNLPTEADSLDRPSFNMIDHLPQITSGNKYYLLGYPGIGGGGTGIMVFGLATSEVDHRPDRDIHFIRTISSSGMSGSVCLDNQFKPVGVLKGAVRGENPGVLVDTLESRGRVLEKIHKATGLILE